MSYTLSIVNIISDQYRDAINNIAKSYGTGDNSMSVKLVDKDNNVFCGCHGWWQPEHYAYFKNALPPSNIPLAAEALAAEALAALYERIINGGVPIENWTAALDELGLSVWADPNLA